MLLPFGTEIIAIFVHASENPFFSPHHAQEIDAWDAQISTYVRNEVALARAVLFLHRGFLGDIEPVSVLC